MFFSFVLFSISSYCLKRSDKDYLIQNEWDDTSESGMEPSTDRWKNAFLWKPAPFGEGPARDSVKMLLEYRFLRSSHGGNSSLIRISCVRVRHAVELLFRCDSFGASCDFCKRIRVKN